MNISNYHFLFSTLIIWILFITSSCIKITDYYTRGISMNTTELILKEGKDVNFTCIIEPPLDRSESVLWFRNGTNMTHSIKDPRYSRYRIPCEKVCVNFQIKGVEPRDSANYSCNLYDSIDGVVNKSSDATLTITPFVTHLGLQNSTVKAGSEAILSCSFEISAPVNAYWSNMNDPSVTDNLRSLTEYKKPNDTYVEMILRVPSANGRYNGTYLCNVELGRSNKFTQAHLFVLDVPHVYIDAVKVINSRQIYLNWTAFDGNEPITEYFLQFLRNNTGEWTYYGENIDKKSSSFIMKNLEPTTSYKLKLHAKNLFGEGPVSEYPNSVTTLTKDVEFVPELILKGTGSKSINVDWSPMPDGIAEYIHYYKFLLYNNFTTKEIKTRVSSQNSYIFLDLNSATTYFLKISSCNGYSHDCGNWSKEISATTLDGPPGPPMNITCQYNSVGKSHSLFVSWLPPNQTNGIILHYNIWIEGSTPEYKNERHDRTIMPYNRRTKSTNVNYTQFDDMPPYTDFIISVSGVTRSRNPGKEGLVNCSTPPTLPTTKEMDLYDWSVYEVEEGKWFPRVLAPVLAESTGPICCYRMFIVRLESGGDVDDLPPPEELTIYSKKYVDFLGKGAYLGEAYNWKFKKNQEYIIVGDEDTFTDSSDVSGPCSTCISPVPRIQYPDPPIPRATTTSTVPPPFVRDPNVRHFVLVVDDPPPPDNRNYYVIDDGPLNPDTKYTGFFQAIVKFPGMPVASIYSKYFTPIYPTPYIPLSERLFTIFLWFLFLGGIGLVLVVCGYSYVDYYSKQVAEVQGVEMSFRNSVRHLCRTLRSSHMPVVYTTPDVTPVSRQRLVQVFADLAKDSDYGFEQEFEALPDSFNDRTTRASDARENVDKNRYPDIKAYDQTRVKLSMIDEVPGSDYINANFVIAYKELKKFICAQGPMDVTVCDFWRMIWEQHLEFVIMLTNLEEHRKKKCARYWPSPGEDSKVFGDMEILNMGEQIHADYLIRELKMIKTTDSKREERLIVHFHYLTWRDFQAPKHPSSILSFIKRVNQLYSLEKGPILVHCSAGVGRTGTFVAIDSLIQQLDYEGQVSIFNTVHDLRRQRNYLVQSLKQYIFTYKSIVEYSQFGFTDIRSSELRCVINKLKRCDNGKSKSRMEEEYDKIVEFEKSVCAKHSSFSYLQKPENQRLLKYEEGSGATPAGKRVDNIPKNRSSIIPFDRNRVFLTAFIGKEHSTYINASFVEGYHSTDSFIITQDPMPDVTVDDFWRMISEHNAKVIVMLSSATEGINKCPRYWPDEESIHGNIKVQHIQSESCPYYTRREFLVANTKTGEEVSVTQYQYNGWPTVEGGIPEVTRGLIELVDQTLLVEEAPAENGVSPSPIVVHCELGTDRSSMFVGLRILAEQIRNARTVDVVNTARKIRLQREGSLSSFAQYEFLYRAALNYAELHHYTGDIIHLSP